MKPASDRHPHGDVVWVSGRLPGAVPDLTAARIWGIVRELAASGADRVRRACDSTGRE